MTSIEPDPVAFFFRYAAMKRIKVWQMTNPVPKNGAAHNADASLAQDQDDAGPRAQDNARPAKTIRSDSGACGPSQEEQMADVEPTESPEPVSQGQVDSLFAEYTHQSPSEPTDTPV